MDDKMESSISKILFKPKHNIIKYVWICTNLDRKLNFVNTYHSYNTYLLSDYTQRKLLLHLVLYFFSYQA